MISIINILYNLCLSWIEFQLIAVEVEVNETCYNHIFVEVNKTYQEVNCAALCFIYVEMYLITQQEIRCVCMCECVCMYVCVFEVFIYTFE